MTEENKTKMYEKSVLSPDVAPFFPKNYYQQNATEGNENQNINCNMSQPPESIGSYYAPVNYPYFQSGFNSWRAIPVPQPYGMPLLQPTHFYQASRGRHFTPSSSNERHYNTSRWYVPAFRQANPMFPVHEKGYAEIKPERSFAQKDNNVTTESTKKSSGGSSRNSSSGSKGQKFASPKRRFSSSIEQQQQPPQQRPSHRSMSLPDQQADGKEAVEQPTLLKTYQRTTERKQRFRKSSKDSEFCEKQQGLLDCPVEKTDSQNADHNIRDSFTSNSEFPALFGDQVATFTKSCDGMTEHKSDRCTVSHNKLSYSEALKSEQSRDSAPNETCVWGQFVNKQNKQDKRKKKQKDSQLSERQQETRKESRRHDNTGLPDDTSTNQSEGSKDIKSPPSSAAQNKCRVDGKKKNVSFCDAQDISRTKVMDTSSQAVNQNLKENIPPVQRKNSTASNSSLENDRYYQNSNTAEQKSSSQRNRSVDYVGEKTKGKPHQKKQNHLPKNSNNAESTFGKLVPTNSADKEAKVRSNQETKSETAKDANLETVAKKKKKRKSSRKRKAMLQSGKVTVISSELHQVLMNHVSNWSNIASAPSSQAVNITSSEEYPELGFALPNKTTKPNDAAPSSSKCMESVDEKTESVSDEAETVCSPSKAPPPPPLNVWDLFKSSLYSDVLKKQNQQPPTSSLSEPSGKEASKEKAKEKNAKGSSKESKNAAANQAQQNKNRTKYTPHAPIDLDITDLLEALQAIKTSTQKKKKEAKLSPYSKQAKKKPGESAPRNLLDSSAPLKKRGKEREKPRKKRPSLMKKIILRERLERKIRHSKKIKSTGGVLNEFGEQGDELTDNSNASSCQDETTSSTKSYSAINDVDEEHLGEENDREINYLSRAKEIVHTRHFREYCTQLLSDEIDETVKMLLEDLVRFQDRMFQKDPIKARMKRRLVFGLREVTKHLKLKKIKCIIVAPDVERIKTAGGLDDALQTILRIAAESSVPAIFALKRTQLGKLCKKSVPVSCIGIFNYEGTEESYKTLLELSTAARRAYTEFLQYVQSHLASCEDCRDASSTSATTLSHMPSCNTFLAQANTAGYDGEKHDYPPSSLSGGGSNVDDDGDDDEWEEINEVDET